MPSPIHESLSPMQQLGLRIYSSRLIDNAAYYDLDSKRERDRSTRDLASLFFQLVDVFQPDLFIEAGAKDGSASLRARKAMPTPRVVAFEGNPYTHARFKHRFEEPDQRVEYLHTALSDGIGKVTFNVRLREDGRPSADGQGSLMPEHEVRHRQVTVPTTTLDDFFADSPYENCVLWIDVEGAQDAVLRGATKTLQRASVLIIEVEDRPMRGQAWLRPAIESYLYSLGLVPVARDFQSRYVYNIVFVRETLLDVDRCRWKLALYQSKVGSRRVARSTGSLAKAANEFRMLLGRVRRALGK